MLVIRKEQMEALSNAIRQRFIDQMVEHLNTVFPDKLPELPGLDMEHFDESLESLINRLIDKAAALDIITEKDVARYIDFVIDFGEDYDKKRDMLWAVKILGNKRLSGSARVSLLYEQLPFKAPESRLAKP